MTTSTKVLLVAAAAAGVVLYMRRRKPCCAGCAGDVEDLDDGPESDGVDFAIGGGSRELGPGERIVLFAREAFSGSSSPSSSCAGCGT